MLSRVRAFGKEHQALFPDSTMGGQWFAAIGVAIGAIEQHLSNWVVARAEARAVKGSTKAAVYEYLKAIGNTARRVTANEPGVTPFRIPRRMPVSTLISTAKAFIAEATPREQEFVRLGLPPTFLADFGKLVEGLETAAQMQLHSRTQRRLARTGIKETLAQAMGVLDDLDTYVANALRLDPIRLGAWRAARRIEALNPRAASRTSTPASGEAETAPPDTAPVATPTEDVSTKAS